ncbi:MAG: site-specific integrase [Planctomycetaceae bacterium]|nr:site-specific integrase [Planctomycetaceae bacterium]
MPKLVNSLPSYRRHKASGQAVVTLNGKDHYLGPHGSKVSRDQYDRLIAEWLANGRRTVKQEQASISMEELLAAFWEHAQQYYKGLDGLPTKEVDAYRQAMKPLRALYGATQVESFGPLALKTVRERFIAAGYARSHVNKQVGRLKRIFKWGVENELVSPGVFQALQAVAGLKLGRTEARETKPVEPVSEGLVGAVESHLSRQVWTMIQLQVLTGMRSGEVTAMRGCDLTMNGDAWEYRPQFHKTAYRGKSRIIFLGPQAQELLKPFLKQDSSAFIFSPKDAQLERNAVRREQRQTPMTPSQAQRKPNQQPRKFPGERYTSQSYGRAITDAAKKAGIDHWSPHQLRHTAATRIREKFGLEAAQVILGHSRADVTQIYAEANHKKAADIMSSVG